MGLWLKCPGCQTKNPLSLRVCSKCGQSLDNIPLESRIYVIGPAQEAAPAAHPAPRAEAAIPVAAEAPVAPAAAAPAKAAPAAKPAKQPKKPRKKKS